MIAAIEIAAGLCKVFEGFYSKPYLCPAGVPTIGYGSTHYLNGRAVSLSDPQITQEAALGLLYSDLARFLVQTLGLCPALSQEPPGRVGAILDFTYNLGAGRLKASTLRKRINAKDWDGVKTELMKWTRGGGKELPGLVKRRKAECNLI